MYVKLRTVPVLLALAASLVLPTNLISVPTALAATTPSLSISNASTLEGDTGMSQVVFDVTLSAVSASNVTFAYTTDDLYGSTYARDEHGAALGVASATTTGGDYVTTAGTATISAGQLQKTISVPIFGNTKVNPNRLFSMLISNVSGATVVDGSGTGTIIDDDAIGGVRLGIGDVSMREGLSGNRNANVVVSYATPTTAASTITVVTKDITAKGVASTSTTGGNYVSRSTSITIPAGTKTKVVPVVITPNSAQTGTKLFNVTVSSSYGAVQRSTSTIELRDSQATYSRTGRRSGPPRVALVGDSVTENYQEIAKQQLESRGYQVYKHGLAGAGLQDAAWCKGQLANTVVTNDDPDIVVFESMGNYGKFAKCNSTISYNTPAFVSAWNSVAKQYDTIFTSKGATLYWVVAPQVPTSDPILAERSQVITALNAYYPNLVAANSKSKLINAYQPFGANPPNCSLRDHGVTSAGYCLHLNISGEQLLSNLVNSAIK